ncbi:MAG: 30S ribosomal protein S7 [Solitalea-like symbiont of Acarus siro]
MRKSKPKKRNVAGDYVYNDPRITKFINALMLQGKKSIAAKIFYGALQKVEESSEDKGYDIWHKAMENVMPLVEVRSRRIGGSNFQIPAEIRQERREFLARKWLIRFARERKEKSMINNLAQELLAASRGEGLAVKRKTDTHKMAESNKAFSHFRV